MGTPTGPFIEALAARHRVLVIGGLAVIAHGFNRPTKDADVWLDPLESPAAWAKALDDVRRAFPGLTVHTLPGWRTVEGTEIAEAAEEVGMVRILGLDCPLDVFRRPNEFSEGSFDDVMSRSRRNADGTWLPDALDLAISKDLTGREKDVQDISFLESKAREVWIRKLPTATVAEAKEMFDRFVDWSTCEAALANPHSEVREMALGYLREFAADGDPFSQSLLSDQPVPPP